MAGMAKEEKQETQEWISPIGQSVEDFIAEMEERNPEYKRERELNRPRRELARVLMLRRVELDLSQQELADRMGTSVAVISRLERGRQNFSPETLQRLARALDTRLPDEARAIVAALRQNVRLSTGEIAEALGLSRPATIRRLRTMREEGLIEWVGKGSRDPRAYWRRPASPPQDPAN